MTLRRPTFALLPLPPLAVLASACVSPAVTPSMSADRWAAPPAGIHEVALPSRADAMRRWELPPTTPGSAYAKYTLLASLGDAPGAAELPDVESLGDVQKARAAAEQLAASGLPERTMGLVDLRGAASIAFGAALASRPSGGAVSLVTTFNNWPAPDEIVPAEETLAALVTTSPGAFADGSAGSSPVFLLDAWRMAYRFEEPSDDAYDNRYALSVADLPDVATLRESGIQRVVYVVRSRDQTKVEEDDLHPAFLAWQRAGVEIAMIDLDWLSLPIADPDWDEAFANQAVIVEPRTTVLGDGWFYRRSHGGFGGVHAMPSAVTLAHGGWGGMHGGGG